MKYITTLVDTMPMNDHGKKFLSLQEGKTYIAAMDSLKPCFPDESAFSTTSSMLF